MASNDKNINYLNKNFSDFKNSLVEFAKSYFPNTYTDFSDADPGMMFTEMTSYVGDVLGFYQDTQTQENILLQTKEKENILKSSYVLGYFPKMSYASVASVDLYQVMAISGSAPNYSHAVTVPEYTLLTADNGTTFLTTHEVRFDEASNPEIIFRDGSSVFAKQTVKAISAEIKTKTFSFTSPKKFDKVTIEDENILGIIKAIDITNGNRTWYEVPYLAQDKIFIKQTVNSNYNTDGIPYLLGEIIHQKRFVSRFKNDTTLELQFGAGTSISGSDVGDLIPNINSTSIGTSLIPFHLDGFNRSSAVFTREYGIAPSYLDLEVKYLVGGGLNSNVGALQINQIDTNDISFNVGDSYQTIIVSNPEPSKGGRNGDTVEEIRQNAMNAFQAQNRAVTKEDYALQALGMPSYFGKIAKSICLPESINDKSNSLFNNPLALNLYILAYNSEGKLEIASSVLKNNLKTYIDEFRISTDAVNIKNAFIINIGVNFDITTSPGFGNAEVLANCITKIKEYFAITKWNINQPIVISEIYSELIKVQGVQSVPKVEIINKQGTPYSDYGYDIVGATRKNIVYPSIDPCIFEVKYPDNDIQGRVIVA